MEPEIRGGVLGLLVEVELTIEMGFGSSLPVIPLSIIFLLGGSMVFRASGLGSASNLMQYTCLSLLDAIWVNSEFAYSRDILLSGCG